MKRTVWILVAVSMVVSCAVEQPLRESGPAAITVLAELPILEEPIAKQPRADDVVAQYQRVLGTAAGSVNETAIARRLADLQLSGAQAPDATDAATQLAAIALYESLLDAPDLANPDEVVYRLARAYDTAGDTAAAQRYLDRLIAEYPYSTYVVEARFRRAEGHFSADRFAQAAEDYRYVVGHGGKGPYWQNATYMLAWTDLRLGRSTESLAGFLTVLPQTLVGDEVRDRASQELLDDVLRGAVLAIDHLNGAETLSAAMAQLDEPIWQHRVFEQLAREREAKGRILDSVAARSAFIDRNPMDWRAAVFAERAITALENADFPADVARHKARFVARYGIRGDYWSVYSDDERHDYRPTLKSYLTELAAFAHADAQVSHRPKDFGRAASLYEELIQTFPNDAAVPEHLFLLGEAYTEANMAERAIASYQRVVHDYREFEHAGEAAYAAVLGFSALTDAAPPDARGELSRRTIEAEITFAGAFPEHAQAGQALTAAAVAAYDLGDYALAIELADRLAQDAQLAIPLQRTALLVAGQAEYELARYAPAERAYRAYLAVRNDESPKDDDVRTKLLAAIFKQAEIADQAGDSDAAIAHFLRLGQIDVDAELTIQGLYDAVAIREAQGQWFGAAQLLSDLRERYGHHALAGDATRRLADLYEKASQIRLATTELRRLSEEDADPDVRRQALYRAAELYLAVNPVVALACFHEYADTYPEPSNVALEAMDHAARLSQEAGDRAAYRIWLKRTIASVGSLPSPTDRARNLAAQAELVFADDARTAFLAIALDAPMAASLKRKQAALKTAVSAYERVAAYGVAQFATASTFNIAEIYAALAESIVGSARPDGLSELELAQYEVLLEEQAVPFEERAIELHELNARRSWTGVYDEWVQHSFDRLRVLFPARFDKAEAAFSAVDSIR